MGQLHGPLLVEVLPYNYLMPPTLVLVQLIQQEYSVLRLKSFLYHEEAFMSRLKLLALWILCTAAMPALSLVMLIHVLFGSTQRARNMAIAVDECGNSASGGPPTQTISSRVGDAVVENQSWAVRVAPIIDFFFGKGHCA